MGDYEKVVKSKLSLKGAQIGKKKRKKSKKEADGDEGADGEKQKGADETPDIAFIAGASTKGKTYEELFPAEKKRMQEAKGRTVTFGTNYRQAPDVLHGYKHSWKNKKIGDMSVEERLDLRMAQKADKWCK